MFHLLFLQADTATLPLPGPTTAKETISVLGILWEGGVLMIPLLLCSLVMVYVFVERYLAIRKASTIDPTFMNRIRDHVSTGNLAAARSLSKNTDGPIARMIEKGLNRIGRPVDLIETSMEGTGKVEVYKMEKNMGILSTIASIAPMFGFLGTLAGMLILFFDIQHQGFELQSFAGGIYTKLVTSITGLIIGLISYVAYKYLDAQINRQVNRMEMASAEFVDIILEPAKAV